MKSLHRSFNIYFTLLCAALASGGCAVFHGKKEQSTIRLYMEGAHANQSSAGTVLVTSNKFPYSVEREPFLDEGDLSKASIIDDADGSFAIQLRFNDHGALLLDMYSSSNKGKHIVVFSQFPDPHAKKKKGHKKSADADDADLVDRSNSAPVAGSSRDSGWIAAVLVRDRLSNGMFRFTPDASRAEGLRIVRGLRNVIGKNGDKKN